MKRLVEALGSAIVWLLFILWATIGLILLAPLHRGAFNPEPHS